MIHFSCPKCEKKLRTDAAEAQNRRTWRTKCPQCRETIFIPRSVGALTPFDAGTAVIEYEYVAEYPEERVDIPAIREQPVSFPLLLNEFEDGEQRKKMTMFAVSVTAVVLLIAIPVGVLVLSSGTAKSPQPTQQAPRQPEKSPPANPPEKGKPERLAPAPPKLDQPNDPRLVPEQALPQPLQKEPTLPFPPNMGNAQPPDLKEELKPSNPGDGQPLELADPQEPKQSSDRPKQNKDDLPDVELVIPEDTRPEIKAILISELRTLRSRRNATERATAAEALGELRENAKAISIFLVLYMLNSNEREEIVRVACANALKKVDPKMQYLAIALITADNRIERKELLTKVERLSDDGYPLAPIVVDYVRATSPLQARAKPGSQEFNLLSQDLATFLDVLSHIASRDQDAHKKIASFLLNPSELVRRSAIEGISRMKHGGLATGSLIALLQRESPANLVAVIRTLVIISDKSTEDMIEKAINQKSLRLHRDQAVRDAVDRALNDLENKKNRR